MDGLSLYGNTLSCQYFICVGYAPLCLSCSSCLRCGKFRKVCLLQLPRGSRLSQLRIIRRLQRCTSAGDHLIMRPSTESSWAIASRIVPGTEETKLSKRYTSGTPPSRYALFEINKRKKLGKYFGELSAECSISNPWEITETPLNLLIQ